MFRMPWKYPFKTKEQFKIFRKKIDKSDKNNVCVAGDAWTNFGSNLDFNSLNITTEGNFCSLSEVTNSGKNFSYIYMYKFI